MRESINKIILCFQLMFLPTYQSNILLLLKTMPSYYKFLILFISPNFTVKD